jgi:hypothetical protein
MCRASDDPRPKRDSADELIRWRAADLLAEPRCPRCRVVLVARMGRRGPCFPCCCLRRTEPDERTNPDA